MLHFSSKKKGKKPTCCVEEEEVAGSGWKGKKNRSIRELGREGEKKAAFAYVQK